MSISPLHRRNDLNRPSKLKKIYHLSYAKSQKIFSDNYDMFIAPVIPEVCFVIQVQWTAKELRDT